LGPQACVAQGAAGREANNTRQADAQNAKATLARILAKKTVVSFETSTTRNSRVHVPKHTQELLSGCEIKLCLLALQTNLLRHKIRM
jgi:hypothetical protein